MEDRAAVLYDEDCGFCKWSLNRILRWDRRGRLRPVAIQSEEGARLLAPVDDSIRLDSWHLALPSGEVVSAGAALAPLAELLPGGRPLAFLARRFPRTVERGYRFVADHRDRFGKLVGGEACELRPRPDAVE
jgi:predicted DCC family thiol-disulfide oxidoreductase YuxK